MGTFIEPNQEAKDCWTHGEARGTSSRVLANLSFPSHLEHSHEQPPHNYTSAAPVEKHVASLNICGLIPRKDPDLSVLWANHHLFGK